MPGGGAGVGAGGAVGAGGGPTLSSTLVSPDLRPEITFLIPLSNNRFSTRVRFGDSLDAGSPISLKIRAAAPLTCGQAIDVPDKLLDPVSDETLAETTDDPGAQMLTRASSLVVDPTVTAFAAKAGLRLNASLLLLPAATTTTTPVSVAASMTVECPHRFLRDS